MDVGWGVSERGKLLLRMMKTVNVGFGGLECNCSLESERKLKNVELGCFYHSFSVHMVCALPVTFAFTIRTGDWQDLSTSKRTKKSPTVTSILSKY